MKPRLFYFGVLAGLLLGFGSRAVPAAASPGAEPAAVVAVKKEARVAGDRICLKDVAELKGEPPQALGELELGHSPWPGRTRRVSRELIEMRCASGGFKLSELRIKGADVCIVRRAVQKVSSEEVLDAARSYVREQLPQDEGAIEMAVLNSIEPVSVPDGGEKLKLRAGHSGNGKLTGRVTVSVSIVRGGKEVTSVPVRLRVSLYRRAAVAAESIGISEPVTAAKVRWARRDVGDSSSSCIVTKDQLGDKLAARSISPGQVITRNMLKGRKSPVCVKPRQRVKLIVETDVLRVVTEGRALSQGRKGETITVENTKTGRKVSGTITGKRKVNVHM